MKPNILESEKEKYIHSDYHELLLFERYENMKLLQTAVELGDIDTARELLWNSLSSIHTINHLYTPKEHNVRVFHNQLVSMNTFFMICTYRLNPNPLYLHTISRHYDTMIEKVTTEEQAAALMEDMLKDYCSLSVYREKKQYSPIVQKAIWHITADPAKKLSLNHLASLLGMSPSALSRKFHTETGQTISQYHTAFRMRIAQHYLQETGCSVTQAAYIVGFTDASYFTKVFTRCTGITPSEYSQQAAL